MEDRSLTTRKEKTSMGLDHSNAFVRVTFDGLIAFCYDRRGDCEMGMVQADDHQPILTLTRINPDGSTIPERRFDLTVNDNVTIDAQDPVELGAHTFPRDIYGTEFDRLSTSADPEDFRWIMDLQGRDFHGAALRLKRGQGDPPTARLRPRISVPHGIFYTLEKTTDTFMRNPRTGDATRPRNIGKIADKVGADIICIPDNGRVKLTVGQYTRELKRFVDEQAFRYRIDITNLCRADGPGPRCPTTSAESDFPLYYRVAEDEDRIEFDVRNHFVQGDPRGKISVEDFVYQRTGEKVSLPEFAKRFSNGPPQVCAMVFLSKTTTIP
jgi:hypothetical protein